MDLGRNPPKEEGGGDKSNDTGFAAARQLINSELLMISYYENI